MSVYLVTWDLNREKYNYSAARNAFITNLDRYENIKDPGLDSVRFISTNWGVNEVSDDLKSKLDDNDRLFVIKLAREQHQGWLSKQTWDWVDARL